MTFSLCSSDAAEFMNIILKKWCKCEVFFCKLCELVTKRSVALIRMRKATFDVHENVLSLECGRYMQIMPLNIPRPLYFIWLLSKTLNLFGSEGDKRVNIIKKNVKKYSSQKP